VVVLPTAAVTVNVLLQELQAYLTQTSNSSSRNTSTSTSSTGRSNSAASDIPPSGAAAVLALLGPCSLVWGELLALHVSTGSDEAQPVGSIAALVTSLWRTSLLVREQGAEQQASKAAAAQQQQQRLDSKASFHDSWYRSCVELIVPLLLHMRAMGAISAADYSAAAGCFLERLELLLLKRLTVALLEGGFGHKGLWMDRTRAERG
jgi:hypothetical protein